MESTPNLDDLQQIKILWACLLQIQLAPSDETMLSHSGLVRSVYLLTGPLKLALLSCSKLARLTRMFSLRRRVEASRRRARPNDISSKAQ